MAMPPCIVTRGVRTMRIRSALRRGGTLTHLHTYTPTHHPATHALTRAYNGACFNISSPHTHTHNKFGLLRVTHAATRKEKAKKMLKITFDNPEHMG